MVRRTDGENQQLHGAGYITVPTPKRHIKVVKPPRIATDSTVLVTYPDGHRRRLSRNLTTIKDRVTVVKEPPMRKRTQFAATAEYGETWANKSSNEHAATEREHWFRGIKFESQLAIEAYIANDCK